MKKKLRWVLGLGLGLPFVLIAGLVGSEYYPNDIEEVIPVNNNYRYLSRNEEISLISWNIQFGASRKHHFFYDGGDVVHVPKEDVLETTEKIKELLYGEGAEITLLQEVDRFSDRTQNIDELEILRSYFPETSYISTPYHKASYVPHPAHQHLGKVNMNLAILSQYQLELGKRHQLALLKEPRWRQYFNLKRAILESEILLDNQRDTLKLAVTHLSAFSRGDGTLTEQVNQLKKWMDSQPPNQAWILAGDFNLLPPEEYIPRLGDDAKLYADTVNPIEVLLPKYKTAFSDLLAVKNYSYLPFNATEPDRKIDYIFYGGPITIRSAQVLRYASDLSDHLPLKIRFTIDKE